MPVFTSTSVFGGKWLVGASSSELSSSSLHASLPTSLLPTSLLRCTVHKLGPVRSAACSAACGSLVSLDGALVFLDGGAFACLEDGAGAGAGTSPEDDAPEDGAAASIISRSCTRSSSWRMRSSSRCTLTFESWPSGYSGTQTFCAIACSFSSESPTNSRQWEARSFATTACRKALNFPLPTIAICSFKPLAVHTLTPPPNGAAFPSLAACGAGSRSVPVKGMPGRPSDHTADQLTS